MLEIRQLTKKFRSIPALEEASFTARAGAVTGYLGPNGSGKSTTIKIVTGLMDPDEGLVLWQGRDTRADLEAFKAQLGYVPEEPHLYLRLSGAEYLELAGQLRDIPPRLLREKIGGFLDVLGLYEDRYTLLSGYSKGMRQKILLAAALLHNPELIILDEPFTGLDPASALVLRRLIQSLGEAGKTVLFSSHELDTVERIAQQVIILSKGRVVADGTVAELRDLVSAPSLEEVFRQLAVSNDPDAIARRALEVMRA
jgi:ABC-2 type transport system ATP-binding protein